MDQSADRLWQQAQRHMGAGNLDAARPVLHALLRHEPKHSAAHMTLGHIAWAGGRIRESAYHVLQVAGNPPAEGGAIIAVAMALIRVGETVAARECLGHPVLAGSTDGQVLTCQAALYRQIGEDQKALAVLDRARDVGVDGSEFRFVRGLELLICGKLAEGEADLEMSLRMDPCAGAAALELARIRKQTADRNHLADFTKRLHRVRAGTQDHAALEFARYKELEDIGQYAEAWRALDHANRVMRDLHPWNAQEARWRTEELIRLCTPESVSADLGDRDGPQPIFILGLPRSGTTLLDRLLGSHPEIASVGELEDFAQQLCWAADRPGLLDAAMLERLPDIDYSELGERYLSQTRWRASGARFFIDKQPWNHAVAGLIARALPNARILHIARDPMDVCFSNFRAMLGGRYAYSFDQETLGQHYLDYCRLQAHWRQTMPQRMLDLSYHELVHDTEGTMRKVVAFCGLDWNPACIAGNGNRSAIGTLSAVQARGPIHRRGFEQWRPYQSRLSPLARALGLIQARSGPI